MIEAERIKQLAEWIAAASDREAMQYDDWGYVLKLCACIQDLAPKGTILDGAVVMLGARDAEKDMQSGRCRYLEQEL